jgi:hypothetical protein
VYIYICIYRGKKKKRYNPEYTLEIQAPHNSEKQNVFIYFGRFVTIVVVVVVVHEYVVIDDVVFDWT